MLIREGSVAFVAPKVCYMRSPAIDVLMRTKEDDPGANQLVVQRSRVTRASPVIGPTRAIPPRLPVAQFSHPDPGQSGPGHVFTSDAPVLPPARRAAGNGVVVIGGLVVGVRPLA
jgi:hypothetical protein